MTATPSSGHPGGSDQQRWDRDFASLTKRQQYDLLMTLADYAEGQGDTWGASERRRRARAIMR